MCVRVCGGGGHLVMEPTGKVDIWLALLRGRKCKADNTLFNTRGKQEGSIAVTKGTTPSPALHLGFSTW